MKIIYHCFGGSHSSVTAAAVHLGLLSPGRMPTEQELLNLPYFDKTTAHDFGTIRYMGADSRGNDIYVMSKKGLGARIGNVLHGLADLDGRKDEVMLVDTLDLINLPVMLGGFTSRRLQWPLFGRPILFYGMRRVYLNIVAAVMRTKARL